MGTANFPWGPPGMGGAFQVGLSGGFWPNKAFYLKPYSGSDAFDGRTPNYPVNTLARALAIMTADKHDVVYFISESNTAANTTEYLSSTLDWNKDLCHIVGVGTGVNISNRQRIAFASTYDTASNLMTISADGCIFENLAWFAGVAGTNPTGCLKVTGSRNIFNNCHIAGIGHANNDIANAYSLYLSGSENVFVNCVIGLDTIARGTADNSELVLTGGGARNQFINCLFLTYAEAATHQFVKKAGSGIDRFVLFKDCVFINPIQSAATAMTEAFDITASGSPNGLILLHNCSLIGADDWEGGTVSGEVYIMTGTAAGNAAGLALAVASS